MKPSTRLVSFVAFSLLLACEGKKEAPLCPDCEGFTRPVNEAAADNTKSSTPSAAGESANAPAPSPGSASESVSTSPAKGVIVSDKKGSGKKPEEKEPEQYAGLTAAAYSDALNLDWFLKYLDKDKAAKIELPQQSPFSYDLKKEDLEKIIPPKSTKAAGEIQVSLVLDVTGSMSDELRYLQKEWKGIISDLKTLLPDLKVSYSLVAYRDVTDTFVTKSLDFTAVVDDYQTELAKYSAGGGGDIPEAVDAALIEANKLSWSKDAETKKLVFWVADAPAHDDDEIAVVDEILKMKDAGISVYPIAASGVDAKAEMTMRIAALLTGGEYIFLTDDSGVGNKHAEPHIPCYDVERLNQLLLRILKREASGKDEEIKKENILRSVGKPSKGVCELTKDESPEG